MNFRQLHHLSGLGILCVGPICYHFATTRLSGDVDSAVKLYDVRPGSEPVFMAPLSVRTLPGLQRSCMQQVLLRLDDLNLDTLGYVAGARLMLWKSHYGTTPDSSLARPKGLIHCRCCDRRDGLISKS